MKMENDQIKLAFSKVKQDILSLQQDISNIKQELDEVKDLLLHKIVDLDTPTDTSTHFPTNTPINPTHQHINPTYPATPTQNPTHPQEIGGLKSPFLGISTGNGGVPTDRQTDRQTVQQTNQHMPYNLDIESNIREASEILNSLDHLKREIRLKFKKLTPQEMSVFSTIYQLEEQNFPDEITYKSIAKPLKLSESSIRDYVQKIISKGIPIKKNKINNKTIVLSISSELKKVATLPTILKLMEL